MLRSRERQGTVHLCNIKYTFTLGQAATDFRTEQLPALCVEKLASNQLLPPHPLALRDWYSERFCYPVVPLNRQEGGVGVK